jgi:hypothetical protein
MSPEERRKARQSRNEEIVSTGDYRQPWRELQLARELQFEMLPASHPLEAEWDLAARSSADSSRFLAAGLRLTALKLI